MSGWKREFIKIVDKFSLRNHIRSSIPIKGYSIKFGKIIFLAQPPADLK